MTLTRILLGWTVSICLFGCAATPSELTEKAPLIEYSSTRSARDITGCISELWSRKWSKISTLLMPNGYVVSLLHPTFGGTDATVTVSERDGGGSFVRYSERLPFMAPGWMKGAITECK